MPTRTASKRGTDAARTRILEAASRLFNERGYNATSIDDIQKACRVQRGSLYFHFESKEDLALDVLESYFAGVAAFLAQRLEEGPTSFPGRAPGARTATAPGPAGGVNGWLGLLFAAFGTVADRTVSGGFKGGCLLGNFGQELTAQSDKARLMMKGMFDKLVATVAVYLERAKKAGELGADADVERSARLFVSGFHGALIELKVYRDRRVYDQAMDGLKGLLVGTR